MKWETCYICYIVYSEGFTVLHFVLHGVTICYVIVNVLPAHGVFGEMA
jgi:hypothetical protein